MNWGYVIMLFNDQHSAQLILIKVNISFQLASAFRVLETLKDLESW